MKQNHLDPDVFLCRLGLSSIPKESSQEVSNHDLTELNSSTEVIFVQLDLENGI